MTAPKPSRRAPNPQEVQAIHAAYHVHGSMQKTADALGIPRHRVVKAIYRAEGRCQCGRPLNEGYATCTVCLDRSRRGTERRHAERSNLDVCRECGGPLSLNSIRFCDRHLLALRENQEELRKRRRDAGSCSFCWEPRVEGSIYCERHRAFAAVHSVRSRSKTKFGGLLEAVLERDGHCCRVCSGTKPRIEVHHIHGRVNSMENLITMCAYCHKAVTFLNYCRDADAVWKWFQQHPPTPVRESRTKV